ncbi:hypothetical protein CNY67_14530 [Desulfovibrio sp. G11]|nr:hypothetical protein CNY67_14530 [Desulfovibrio sp. G11]
MRTFTKIHAGLIGTFAASPFSTLNFEDTDSPNVKKPAPLARANPHTWGFGAGVCLWRPDLPGGQNEIQANHLGVF